MKANKDTAQRIPTDFANRRTQICGHPFSAIVTSAEGERYVRA